MHAKRSSELDAARERQARRRRLAGEQQAAAEATEHKSKLDTLLASLYKKSDEEQRVAARLQQACSHRTCAHTPVPCACINSLAVFL